MTKFSVSERFACKVLGQHRSTQRNKLLAGQMKRRSLPTLSGSFPGSRYDWRRITVMLRFEHRAATLIARLQTTGAGGHRLASTATQENTRFAGNAIGAMEGLRHCGAEQWISGRFPARCGGV